MITFPFAPSVRCALVAFMALASAWAGPIFGEISFEGSYTVDRADLRLATRFNSFNHVTVADDPTGSYAGLGGEDVTMNGFNFAAFPTTGVTWWYLNSAPTTSFDLLTLSIDFRSRYVLVLSGTGVARMGGDEELGNWVITANSLGSTFSFSATQDAVPSDVPDEGASIWLSVAGLALAFVGAWKVGRNSADGAS